METKRRLTIDEQLGYLRKGTVETIRETSCARSSPAICRDEETLRVKLGADLLRRTYTCWPYVVIRKLRAFQEVGHVVIFLIGDFTGMIGDPRQDATRPQLTRAEIEANAETTKHRSTSCGSGERRKYALNSEWIEQAVQMASSVWLPM